MNDKHSVKICFFSKNKFHFFSNLLFMTQTFSLIARKELYRIVSITATILHSSNTYVRGI